MSRDDNIQVILGKMGAGTSPAEPEFFCGNPEDLSATLQRPIFSNLVTKRSLVLVSRRAIRKDIFENFNFRGHLLPKSEIESRSNRHLTQSRLQVTGYIAERYCLLHVVVQGPGSFRDWSIFLYHVRLRSYRASNLCNFRIFSYFPCTKLLKRTFRWPAYSPEVTLQNDYDISTW